MFLSDCHVRMFINFASFDLFVCIDSVQYLVGVDSAFAKQRWNVSSLQELLNPDSTVLLAAWHYLGAMSVAKAAKILQNETQNLSFNEAWDAASALLLETAKIHALLYSVNVFHSLLVHYRRSESSTIYNALIRLFQLFALYHMQNYIANLLECEFVTPTQTELIRKSVDSLCAMIRRDAVALVDAFLLPDWMLNSSLGVYNGDIYRCTFERVNAEKRPVRAPYWEDEIKPLTNPKTQLQQQ